MIKFKTFLTEYLTAGQRKLYADTQMTEKARADTDHFFGVGNDHVQEDVIGLEPDKSEVHRAVERHIGKQIHHNEYVKGVTKDQHGRDVRLGRLIRDDNLRNQFANDNARAGSKRTSGHYMTIVRGTEVAGQTNSQPNAQHPKGHSWGEQSCKNVDTGVNRSYLKHEIMHGTVVVRAHDHTGQEIYRATLQPHHNPYNDKTAYNLDSEYGLKHPAFTAHAHDVARRLSGEYELSHPEAAVFVKHEDVYNDNGERQMLHPGLKNADLHSIVDSNPSAATMILAAKHHNVDDKLLDKAMEYPSARVHAAAASNPRASAQHLHKALDSANFSVQLAAAQNPNIRPEHVDKILKSGADSELLGHIAKHPSMQRHHIDQIIDSKNQSNIYSIMNSRHINAEHLDKILKIGSQSLKKQVAKHRRATPEHLDKLLDDANDLGVMEAAAGNRNASEATLMKALSKHGLPTVQQAAVTNENASDSFLHHVLDHPSIASDVRVAAADNQSAGSSVLHRALVDHDPRVRMSAAENPNATEEHLHKAMGDEDYRVRRSVVRNPNITKEILQKGLNDPHERVRISAENHPRYEELIGPHDAKI